MKLREVKREPVIALAQIKYYDLHPHHNVEKIKKYIRLAKSKGADIICFPESCVHKTKAMHFNHKLISEIKEECQNNSIWCIIDEDMHVGIRTYNVALLINRCGKIVGHYKKINLYGDTKGLRPGKRVKIFKTDFGKIGIGICWDLASPDLFRKMKKKGAEIIFCPVFWAYGPNEYHTRAYKEKYRKMEMDALKSLAMARAYENILFVALCNPYSQEKDLVPYSAIFSPNKVICELKKKEGMIIHKIDLNEIERVTKAYRVQKNS